MTRTAHSADMTGHALISPADRARGCVVTHLNGQEVTDWPARIHVSGGALSVTQDGQVALHHQRQPLAPWQTRDGDSFRCTVRGPDGDWPDMVVQVALHAPQNRAQRGWNAGWHSGLVDGTYVVDPARGDDAAAGTVAAPLRSVQAAVDRLNPAGGDTVLLRGGAYRDPVSFQRLAGATRPTRVVRYADERPLITGAARLTGWTACDASDRARVGNDLSGLYKTRISDPNFNRTRLEGMVIREDGELLGLATDEARPGDDPLFGLVETFHRADRFIIADGKIQRIRHPGVLNRYSTDQLMQTIGVVWSRDNRLVRFDPGAVLTDDGNTLVPANPPDKHVSDGPDFWRYALRNSLIAIRPGQWATYLHSDGSATIYLRPRNAAGLDQRITYSRRQTGWDLGGANHLHIAGLDFQDFGGAGRHEGIALGNIGSDSRFMNNTGIVLHNCRFAACNNPSANYGIIFIRDANELSITNCTFANSANGGLFLMLIHDLFMQGCLLENLGATGLSLYNAHRAIFAHSDLRRVARSAHANSASIYGTPKGIGIDKVLLYGLRVSGAKGYITWQGASRVDMAFCDMSASELEADIRSTVDQNSSRGRPPPEPGSICFLWNNLFRHDPGNFDNPGGSLRLGQPGVNLRYVLTNNVIGGGGTVEPYRGEPPNDPPTDAARAGNVYIKLAWWQGSASGWALQPNEVYFPSLREVFGDGRGEGFRLMPDSPLRRVPAADMRQIIGDILSERYPGFDFNVDIDGNPVDWSRVRVGPFQGDWNSQIR